MKPFERGFLDVGQTAKTKAAVLQRWIEGKALERAQWPVSTVIEAMAASKPEQVKTAARKLAVNN